MAEHPTVNRTVVGSSPATPANPYPSITQRYFTGWGFLAW